MTTAGGFTTTTSNYHGMNTGVTTAEASTAYEATTDVDATTELADLQKTVIVKLAQVEYYYRKQSISKNHKKKTKVEKEMEKVHKKYVIPLVSKLLFKREVLKTLKELNDKCEELKNLFDSKKYKTVLKIGSANYDRAIEHLMKLPMDSSKASPETFRLWDKCRKKAGADVSKWLTCLGEMMENAL